MIEALIIVIAIVVGVGAHFFSQKNDSPAEQAAEQVLKSKGIDIDFSAESKKKEKENNTQAESK